METAVSSDTWRTFHSNTRLYIAQYRMLTSILTQTTVQSPSWAANWFAASQEIPRISRNPKVHYRTHKRPPPVSNLDQPNPVHMTTSHLLEIHPNIIHPSTPRSAHWSLSLQFPHQVPIHPPLLTYTFFLIISPTQCWVRITDHLAPRFAEVPSTSS